MVFTRYSNFLLWWQCGGSTIDKRSWNSNYANISFVLLNRVIWSHWISLCSTIFRLKTQLVPLKFGPFITRRFSTRNRSTINNSLCFQRIKTHYTMVANKTERLHQLKCRPSLYKLTLTIVCPLLLLFLSSSMNYEEERSNLLH